MYRSSPFLFLLGTQTLGAKRPSSVPKIELEFDLNYSSIVVQTLKHRHHGPSPTEVEPNILCEVGTISTLRAFLQKKEIISVNKLEQIAVRRGAGYFLEVRYQNLA